MYVIGVLIACLLGAASYAVYEHQQVRKQRALAEEMFYNMQQLNVEVAILEREVARTGLQEDVHAREVKARRTELQAGYERLLTALNVYDSKMTEQDRLIMRVARIFGECELNMPPEFKTEVAKYIRRWQQSDRLAGAIQTAQAQRYIPRIRQEFLSQQLPPEFLYLALQESNFDPYASGPVTRSGIAKGMWQFIPETASKYGLRVGPLARLPRPDTRDDRHNWEKETTAAASYIRDLYRYRRSGLWTTGNGKL